MITIKEFTHTKSHRGNIRFSAIDSEFRAEVQCFSVYSLHLDKLRSRVIDPMHRYEKIKFQHIYL